MNSNLSIHPRVWGAWRESVKKNTCAPRSKARIERAIAGLSRHLENHPNDAAGKVRLGNLKARMG